MNAPTSRFERFNQRIKNNPVVASLIILGTFVIALSTFTNAAKDLWDLVITDTRPDINGEWQAEVVYDWPNARYSETFTFRGDGQELHGAASFLGVKRGILEGKAINDEIEFVTRTQEVRDDTSNSKELVHRYRGKVLRDEIEFVMQTENGLSEHLPIKFTARRVVDDSSRPAR